MERSDEIALALGLTLERDTATGRPWCPPTTGARLKRYLTGYGKELDGLSHQSVRLYCAMEAAHRHGAVGFLYGAVNALTPDQFRAAFSNADLSVIGAFDGDTLTLTEPRLLSASGKPFELSMAQLPLVAAHLDVAHNMLGFDSVYDLLKPLWSDDNTNAGQIAGALRNALSGWMRPGLQKEHYLKQARVIAAFLQSQAVSRPEGIDDETILSFWEAQAKLIKAQARGEGLQERPTEGFKTYQNAARLTLFYRRSMQTALNEYNAQSAAVSLNSPTTDDTRGLEIFAKDHQLQTAAGFDGDDSENDHSEWVSPLIALRQKPGSDVKWTKKADDLNLLASLIDSRNETGETHADSQALFQSSPPLMSHIRTVARYCVLGPLQTGWSSNRADHTPDRAVEGYAGLLAQLAQLAVGLKAVRLATAYLLIRRKSAHGAALLSEIDPDATRTMLHQTEFEPSLDGDWAGEFARYFELSEHPMANEARAAYEAINRKGFRKQDMFDDDLLTGLEAGAASLTALITVVDRLAVELESTALGAHYNDDHQRFVATFKTLYGRDDSSPANR